MMDHMKPLKLNDERPDKLTLADAEIALLHAQEYHPTDISGEEKSEWHLKLCQTRAMLSIAYSLSQLVDCISLNGMLHVATHREE